MSQPSSTAAVNPAEFEAAVLLVMTPPPAGTTDAAAVETHARASSYIQSLSTAPDAYRLCMGLLLSTRADPARFFALQALSSFIASPQYCAGGAGADAARRELRGALLSWASGCLRAGEAVGPGYVRSKLGLAVARMIRAEYPVGWPTAFRDVYECVGGPGASMPGLDTYLDVLLRVQEEVVEEASNMALPAGVRGGLAAQKDAMRGDGVPALVADVSFSAAARGVGEAGAAPPAPTLELAVKALTVLTEYVSWIDVDLVANSRFAELYYSLLRSPSSDLRLAVVRLLQAILHKGMDDASRLRLLRGLGVVQLLTGAVGGELDADEEVLGPALAGLLEVHTLLQQGVCRTPPGLSAADVRTHCRSMLVPGYGPRAQAALGTLRVLLVGAGGTGCPAALYLAAGGVKCLTVMDDDVVEASNLARQVCHSWAKLGHPKAASLCAFLTSMGCDPDASPPPVFTPLVQRFAPTPACDALVATHDVVVDACDNPGTRYALSDACVRAGVPLVSGAALRSDGQVSVYCGAAPCYRCIHPAPPSLRELADGGCGDVGVLSGVTGVVGCMLALEVGKIAVERGGVEGEAPPVTRGSWVCTGGAARGWGGTTLRGKLFVLDGADARARTVTLAGKRVGCEACGATPSMTTPDATAAWLSRAGLGLCEGGGGTRDALPVPELSPPALLAHLANGGWAVDVRPPSQFALGGLAGVGSAPLSVLVGPDGASAVESVKSAWAEWGGGGVLPVLCRRGVDSAAAVVVLRTAGLPAVNVPGGLLAVARLVKGLVVV